MSSEEDEAIAALILVQGVLMKRRKKIKKRRAPNCWVRNLFLDRDVFGYYAKLCDMEPKCFKEEMRMSRDEFDFILERVAPYIKKKNTVMRAAIEPAERLAVTIRYLATGDSMQVMSNVFRLSPTTVCRIVQETCPAIYDSLKEEFLQFPDTVEKWQSIADVFDQQWNFPNCIGALDGKLINYKNTQSIVLMAMTDGEYKFTYVDVGEYHRDSDGGEFSRSSLSDVLENSLKNIPPPKPLSEGLQPVPYVVVADEAFPLKKYLMKPYVAHQQQVMDQRVFNYRLGRAQRVVENAFGIAASRFRILRCIDVSVDRAIKLILAICVLHNFLLTRNKVSNTEEVDTEIKGEIVEGAWRAIMKNEKNFRNIVHNNVDCDCDNATNVREQFKTHFVTPEGEVAWQYNTVMRMKPNT